MNLDQIGGMSRPEDVLANDSLTDVHRDSSHGGPGVSLFPPSSSFGSPETKRGHFQPFLGGHGKCSAGSSVFNVDGSVLGRFSSLSKDFILSTNLSR